MVELWGIKKMGLFGVKVEKVQEDKDSLPYRARQINEVLKEIGIPSHTEAGKDIRKICALELLGQEYETLNKYSKSTFIKSMDKEQMLTMVEHLREEGLLNSRTPKKIEDK